MRRNPKAYYHYGEGSIHHNGNPCKEGIGQRHPQIQRDEWSSIWSYRKNKVARWWADRKLGRLIWPDGQDETGPVPPVAKFRRNPLDKPILKLFGEPYPRLPELRVGISNEDSIYDRSWEIEYDREKADQEGSTGAVPGADGPVLGNDRGGQAVPPLGDRPSE